jgi:hypothetical protein
MPPSQARRIGLRTHLHDAAVACGRMPAGRRSGTAGRPLPPPPGARRRGSGGERRPPTDVARRAGQGIAVLPKIYVHCIDAQADAGNKRITDALSIPEAKQTPGNEGDADLAAGGGPGDPAGAGAGHRPDLAGERIWVGGQWFSVAGILNSAALAQQLDASVLVGFPTAQKYLGFDGHPSELYVRTVNTQATITRVDNLLGAQANPENPGEVDPSQPSAALTA